MLTIAGGIILALIIWNVLVFLLGTILESDNPVSCGCALVVLIMLIGIFVF
jgi:hypothetical protein